MEVELVEFPKVFTFQKLLPCFCIYRSVNRDQIIRGWIVEKHGKVITWIYVNSAVI